MAKEITDSLTENQLILIQELQAQLVNPEVIYKQLGLSKYDYIKIQDTPKIYRFKTWLERCLIEGSDSKANEAVTEAFKDINKSKDFYKKLASKGLVLPLDKILGQNNLINADDVNIVSLLGSKGIPTFKARKEGKNIRFIIKRFEANAREVITDYFNSLES